MQAGFFCWCSTFAMYLISLWCTSVNWCRSHEPLWVNIYQCESLSAVWFVWMSCNAIWCHLWIDNQYITFASWYGLAKDSWSAVSCHWFCEMSRLFSRSTSPLQPCSWPLRKAQAHFRSMCQLRSHVWHMRQSQSVMGSMSFKQDWEPCHKCKWCHQSCIAAMT